LNSCTEIEVECWTAGTNSKCEGCSLFVL